MIPIRRRLYAKLDNGTAASETAVCSGCVSSTELGLWDCTENEALKCQVCGWQDHVGLPVSRINTLQDLLKEALEVVEDLRTKTDVYLGINDAFDRSEQWERAVNEELGAGDRKDHLIEALRYCISFGCEGDHGQANCLDAIRAGWEGHACRGCLCAVAIRTL